MMHYDHPPRESRVYCVPRRFDLATILTVTTVIGMLLALEKWIGLPAPAVLGSLGFIVTVGFSQAMLFAGRNPRTASALTGMICGIGLSLLVETLNQAAMQMAVFGAIVGYITGAIIGSVFLIADYVRTFLERIKLRPPQPKGDRNTAPKHPLE